MSDAQLDIDFKFNSPEAKKEAEEVRKAVAAVNQESLAGNEPLKEREGLLQRLKRRLDEVGAAQQSATSASSLSTLNSQYNKLENDIQRLTRVGIKGFDDQGRVIVSNEGILQRLQRGAALWQKGMLEATNPAALEKYSQKLALVNAEISKITKGAQIGTGWNGLQNSINQIARELPAFTYSVQTGFMAISNNLPIFVDEVNRLRSANAALAAEGKKGVPVWKSLLTGVLSWQTAMMVGITLLTVYGKEIGEWFKGLVGAGNELKKIITSQESVNEVLKNSEYQNAVKDVKNLHIAVSLAQKGFLSKKSVVEEYNNTLGKTTGYVKTLDQVEKFLIDNADDYVKMTMYKAAAQLQLAEAAKEAAAIQENSAKKAEDFTTTSDGFLSIVKTGGAAKVWAKLTGEETKYYDDLMQDAGEQRRAIEQREHEAREKQFSDNAEALLSKAQDYASKMNIDVFGDGFKKPKDTSAADERLYNQILKGRKEFIDKIRSLDNEYRVLSFSDDRKEVEALKQKFVDFRKVLDEENEKIRKYNEKNKASVALIDVDLVAPIERRATADLRYRQETKKEMDAYAIRQKLYDEYEQYKTTTSETQADKRYAKDLDKIKTFYSDVTMEIAALTSKQVLFGLGGAEIERLKQLLETLKEFNRNKQAEQDKYFLESYNLTRTYNEKLADIDKKYQTLYMAQGEELSEEKKELLKAAREEEIETLNQTEARKNRILINAAKQQLVLTTAGIRAQIKVIKDLLAKEGLDPKFREELEKALFTAQGNAELGARAASIANLKKLYGELSDELVRLTKSGASPEKIKAVNDKLLETQEQIDELNREGFRAMLDLLVRVSQEVGQLGESLSNLGDAFGNNLISNAGQFLSGLANGIDNLSVAFDKNATSSEKYAAAISSAIDLISMVANAAAERKQAEEEYYRAVIDMQREYNLSIAEQLRLEAQLGESVYVKDYVGRMRSGMKSAEYAIEEYKKAIAELAQNGKISNGLKNAVDWGSVGEGAVSGATIGGIIGSAIPVIGNIIGAAIGAVVGGIIGLFGGKKKKPKYEDLYSSLPAEIVDVLSSSEPQDLSDVKRLLESLNNDNAVDANTKQMIEGVLDWIEKIEEARAQIKEVVEELTGSLGSDMRNNLVEYFKQGESAALAMGNTVNKVLEDMMSQLLFSKAFDEIFKQFEDQLTDTLLFGEEGDVIDVFAQFLKDAGSAGENYYKWMEAAREAAKEQGLDIFSPTSSDSTLSTSGIERVSEQAATEIVGLGRAQLDIGKQTLLAVQKSLEFEMKSYDRMLESILIQRGIEKNTADTVTELKNAVIELKAIKDNTKGGYYGG
ncbi:hypothetical protein [Sphingobacterium sp. LRF_L2]|uniref:hypothetical protein n=1 Tax=Sphingobacterium sp. LRF_L2 TaxID=3369421 RepID=UPI003F5F77A8